MLTTIKTKMSDCRLANITKQKSSAANQNGGVIVIVLLCWQTVLCFVLLEHFLDDEAGSCQRRG